MDRDAARGFAAKGSSSVASSPKAASRRRSHEAQPAAVKKLAPAALSRSQIKRSMRISVPEGMAWALMVGFGELSFPLDAIRLGASRLEQGLVISVALFAGSLGALVALRLLSRMGRRRPLVAGGAFLQSANLLALAVADLTGRSSPTLVIAAACVHQICGQACGTGWASWYGDLVPARIRGTYFGRRNRWVHLTTCVGTLASGGLLQWLERPFPGRGFACVFALAALARFASAIVLANSPETRFHGLPARSRVKSFFASDRGVNARKLLAVFALLSFFVYVSSPYFTPYMKKELGFSYLEYTAATLALVLAKVTFLPIWGRALDRHGPRHVFALSALLLSLVPLPWLWTGGLGWAIVAQAFSGFAWGGYEIAHFALLVEASYKRTRPHVFATLYVVCGSAQLLGSLAGAAVAALASGNLKAVFAASLAGRFLIGVLMPKLVPPSSQHGPIDRKKLLLQVIGLGQSGGIVRRPFASPDREA